VSSKKVKTKYTSNDVIGMLEFFIDNILVKFGGQQSTVFPWEQIMPPPLLVALLARVYTKT